MILLTQVSIEQFSAEEANDALAVLTKRIKPKLDEALKGG